MPIKQLLTLFDLRDIEINIFNIIASNQTLGATDISKQANISRTSVYDLLKILKEKGLITETQKNSRKAYTAASPEKIQILIEEKQREINQAKKSLEQYQNLYLNQQKTTPPRLQIYEGKKELRQRMKDLLIYKDITIYVYWPVNKIIRSLGKQFMAEFHKKRINRNTQIKALWPDNQIPNIKKLPFLKTNQKLLRKAKIAPRNLKTSLGYAIYGNTVRFISPGKDNFGFLVENAELAQTIKQQFNIIWNISKPYKN